MILWKGLCYFLEDDNTAMFCCPTSALHPRPSAASRLKGLSLATQGCRGVGRRLASSPSSLGRKESSSPPDGAYTNDPKSDRAVDAAEQTRGSERQCDAVSEWKENL